MSDLISRQPKRTDKRTETHACDCISRQAAIDHWRLIIDATNTDSGYNMGFVDGLEFCISHLSTMPSAQPEKLTDKEQRIFLSAMGREEEVCKEVDDAWRDCREPYEDSLVHVCKEIRRKVKGALWT